MMNKDKKTLIVLTGPTAVGKTDLSINLAKKLNGEIISADSAQVYKGFDIGSAKVTKEEMQGVPHHLIDIYEPDFPFDVTVFQKDAEAAIKEIYDKDKLPIIVGGTGFYIQSVLYDIDFSSGEKDSAYREKLESFVDKEGGIDKLYDMLLEVDPVSAEKIHKNNNRKVIRALEYYHFHQKPISEHNAVERNKESVYNSKYFVLTMDREKLYERINMRVDMMRKAGLIEEVSHLRKAGYGLNLTSMQAIGYKEIYAALDEIETNGISSEDERYNEILDMAFEQIKLNTRHFAKRQMTWFRREKDVIWIKKDDFSNDNEILDYIFEKLK